MTHPTTTYLQVPSVLSIEAAVRRAQEDIDGLLARHPLLVDDFFSYQEVEDFNVDEALTTAPAPTPYKKEPEPRVSSSAKHASGKGAQTAHTRAQDSLVRIAPHLAGVSDVRILREVVHPSPIGTGGNTGHKRHGVKADPGFIASSTLLFTASVNYGIGLVGEWGSVLAAAAQKAFVVAKTMKKRKRAATLPSAALVSTPLAPPMLPAKKRFEFAVSLVTTFALFAFLLVQIDFYPEMTYESSEGLLAGPGFSLSSATSSEVGGGEEKEAPGDVIPTRILIDRIGVDEQVVLPRSNDIVVLDEALLEGAVLYPGSGVLGEKRNLLFFGHSSHLPVIHNQAFKAFNDIEKLAPGDIIRVQSTTHEHRYRVTSVSMAPESEVRVNFQSDTKKITLSTCNSFGDKSDRHVVEAVFIDSQHIDNLN